MPTNDFWVLSPVRFIKKESAQAYPSPLDADPRDLLLAVLEYTVLPG